MRRRPPSSRKSRGPARRSASVAKPVLRFRLPSDRGAIAEAVERILQAVSPLGLSKERTSDLAVAASEALSNAAIHGNRLEPGKEVEVTVRVLPRQRAVVDVEDEGEGFDRRALVDPRDPARILATGGRGVFLMNRLVDRLEYNAKGNRVRLTMAQGRRRHGR